MQDLMSQDDIDSLINAIKHKPDSNDLLGWKCEKCANKKTEYELKLFELERKSNLTIDEQKHKIDLENMVQHYTNKTAVFTAMGNTKLEIYDKNKNMSYKGSVSEGITYICLSCGEREMRIPKDSIL